jgi:O-antigen/teichoic acid export membrane protein
MADPAATPVTSGAGTSGGKTGGYMASTVKHGLIYFLGNVLARLAGFIMLPVYTRVLTTGDYGILEILSLSLDIVGMLAGLGIRQAVLRLYYHFSAQEDRNGVVSSASILLVVIFGSITLVGLAFSAQLSEALLGPDQPVLFLRLALLAFVTGALGDIPGVYLQARQRSSALVTANFVRLMLALSLNILFVVYLRIGVAGIFLSTILSAIIVGGFLAVMMFRETGMRFVPRIVRELVSFGSPLVASNVGSFVLHFSDRYFLRHFHSLAVVGIYSLSYKFAMLIAMLVDGPFYSIWSAKAFEIESREGADAPPILRSILLQYNLVVVTAAFGVALFATDVIHIMLGAEFHSADRPVPLLALAMVFFCYRHISQTGAMIARRSGYIAVVTSGAAMAALALNLLLIPRWGAMGAAASTAGAFGLEFMVMNTLSERVYPIGLRMRELLAPVAIACGVWVGAAAVVPDDAGPVAGLAIRIAALGVYALVLSVTGILTPAARQLALRSLREPRAILTALKQA